MKNLVTAFRTPKKSLVALAAAFIAAGPTFAQNAVTYTIDSTTDLPNPEKGWYNLAGSLFDSNVNFQSSLDAIYASGFRLALIDTTLPTVVTDANIATWQVNMDKVRAKGLKAIMLFNCGPVLGCDPTIPQLQAQGAKIQPFLAKNADVIAYAKAGMAGQYGEWAAFTNTNNTKANKRLIRDVVLNMYPKSVPVQWTQVYPPMEDWYSGTGALTKDEAFTGTPKSRGGFHSDCFLTGQGDSFFITGQNTVVDFTITSTNQAQRAYVAAYTEFAPFGTETCGTSPVGTPNPPNESSGSKVQKRLLCDNSQLDETGQIGGIMTEGPRYHLTWMNNSYSQLFVDSWKSGGCYGTITAKMGYRFAFTSISHVASQAKGTTLHVDLGIQNIGWSRIFHPRRVWLTLKPQGGISASPSIVCTGAVDLRTLPSQATAPTKYGVDCLLPSSAASGVYWLQLSMPDSNSGLTNIRNYMIKNANVANAGATIPITWDDTLGRFQTGTAVTIP